MKNTLQLIGSWLASKFNKIEATFSTKNELKNHNASADAHKDIRGKIDAIVNGTTVVGRSEYASIIGTEEEGFTKSQLEHLLNTVITDVQMNPQTYILSFNYRNGSQKTIDLPIEMTVKDGRYDEATKELVLVLVSDQEIRIPASGLIKVYIGKESTTTTVSIDERTGEITVDVKEGSITKEHLSTELQTQIQKLDNLPENANEAFASKESGLNVFKLELAETYSVDNLQDAIEADIVEALGSTTAEYLMNKPSYFSIKYSDVNIIAPIKLTSEPGESLITFVADAYKSIHILNEKNPNDHINWNSLRIDITYLGSTILVNITEAPVIIDVKDFNLTVQANTTLAFNTPLPGFRLNTADLNWSRQNACNTFDELVKYISNHDITVLPSINLKTPTSGSLYPAIVDSTYTAMKREIYSIAIKYPKEIDGVQKLITETLDFNDAGGLSEVVKGVKTYTYSKYAEDVYSSPCIIHVEDGMMDPGADPAAGPAYTVNAEDVEAYHQKVMAGMDKNNVRVVFATSVSVPINVIVQENFVYLEYSNCSVSEATNNVSVGSTVLSCYKNNDTWACSYSNASTVLTPNIYMKTTNIHVVSEHPADLSTYPDGSIFIKTE